ncbi:ABC transporter ATP-binding protein [Beijerinckia mobilis]|uniref:ABC transporter ATP-binding protein n=1 Tax=Beijerinckia mobilis TaxID=231434 RepID=UPI00068D0CB9|nr:ABC transporter ATP-binding protein [Beijerinckia mobilis]
MNLRPDPNLSPSSPPLLVAERLAFSRGARAILHGIDLTIRHGEIVALLGANGAGKTTLLRLLMGFLKPSAGAIRLEGEVLSTLSARVAARRLAYVAQVHTIAFPYSVRDVVLLGRLPQNGLLHAPSDDDRTLAQTILEEIGIGHLADRPYSEISGGERQLAMIARALAQATPILVMDEPLTGLDYGYQIRLIDHLERLSREGRCLIMSTHHPEHALWSATRVILLRDGRIEADGPPEDVLTPDAILRLYGVDVLRLDGPEGRSTFLPRRRQIRPRMPHK